MNRLKLQLQLNPLRFQFQSIPYRVVSTPTLRRQRAVSLRKSSFIIPIDRLTAVPGKQREFDPPASNFCA